MKFFPATVANADIGSLKSLHTFLKNCLFHIPVKIEQSRMVETTQNFELFDIKKKQFFKNHFWQSADTILEDVPGVETIV